MPVIAMEVKTAQNHPNADALRLYSFAAPGWESVQIVANSENIYEVGDIVAIALTDSVLKDGTKIKPVKLRGVYSFGMALGKVEETIGTELSAIYCQETVAQSAVIQTWPSIELLYNLRRSLEAVGEAPKITYRAKVKLDGTNGGIQIFTDGRVAVQSRSQIISPENDNLGFANWVSQNIDVFARLASPEHATIFGEWCGKGIQKRTAVSQVDRKIFAVFAVQFGGVDGKLAKLEICPDKIAEFLPKHPDIFVLPFYGEPFILDFGAREQLASVVDTLNQAVDTVEKVDPWVKETFGIEGLGEGLVMFPESGELSERLSYAELLFKAKGEKHQAVKTKAPVQIDPEVAQSIEDFVNLFVTPARLEQAVTAVGCDRFDMAKIGAFLQWFMADVQKESAAELEVAQLSWKDVNKAVMKSAKEWYQEKAKSL
ncbi:RNA ligase family protein [Microseira wollei]|uniref:Phenylalanyl-tRNA synthetase beta subunit, putative n=1 Tax=Microseira wollei NIES-4236 TaxID=2530354 RepID=A0AAV3XH00_9CYAN|nr:RNA ligase family protein [Microseira wollei]GET40016.1 phenylalanyl-tRNA synthetase beta subunit, putative [Microseira wollei NIES-4236]